MNIRNIFQRDPADDEVPVPEIEVDGDRVRVPANEEPEKPGSGEGDPAFEPVPGITPPGGGGAGHAERGRKTREFRLPKTTWFA